MATRNSKNGRGRLKTNNPNTPKKTSSQQQKASFKDELSSRIESAHKAAQYQRALNREDMEISLGVGDYDLYFKEFINHFRNTRIDKMTKEEIVAPKLKIKELSKLRWRKLRRVPRGKIKNGDKK